VQRLRPLAVVGSIAAVIASVPLLAVAALAADPVVVRPGDTLTSIARRSGVSIEQIVQLNRIADPNRIYVGQELRLEDAPQANALEADASTTTGGQVIHVVRHGESTWGIAMHYGVTVAAVADANGLSNPGRILAGMRLVIPGGTPAPRASQPEPTVGLPEDMAAAVAERDGVRRIVVAEAERFDVPARLALAVAWQESSWRQSVVSHAGAVGVMQLLPSTAEWVSATMLREPINVHDVRDNVRAGVRLLAHYLARYDGSVDLALAAYYQGQTGTDRHGVYPVTRAYVDAIRGLTRLFGG
jgi:N-acetylmuramoyl-L-alanine amidase